MKLTIEKTLKQGLASHREGRVREAERLYRSILQSEPLHPDANHNLGVLAVSVNKAEEALPLFQTALEANPKIEQFWLSYISALIKTKKFDSANKAIEQAKKQGMNAGGLASLEEQLSSEIKKPKIARVNPPQELLNSLLHHYEAGRFNEAEKLSVEITKDFPRHAFAWKVLGAVLGATGRKSEAIDANRTAVALAPKDAEAHSNLGTTLEELGRLDEAEASYTRAIAIKPDYAEAHSNLGNTLQELGRLDAALACHNRAISLKPGFAKAHNNLGNTLQELGESDEALASYKQAIALKSDFAEAHSNLSITLKELGRLEEALASCKRAVALKPDLAEAHNNLGNTLKELGRLAEALASYNGAISLKPDYAKAHSNLGNTLQELGRLDEAEASYYQAIALQPDYAEAHSNLGTTLKALGRLEKALASYAKAIALKPDFAEAHYNLTSMKTFEAQDEQYSKLEELYLDQKISEEQRCHISFGLAKACEDLGDYEKAYAHYSEGNALRKKLLNYDINEDVGLFKRLKANYPRIKHNSPAITESSTSLMAIFIVGMPRSGTTLVEQIISSHSTVTGAGELDFTHQFGAAIATGIAEVVMSFSQVRFQCYRSFTAC